GSRRTLARCGVARTTSSSAPGAPPRTRGSSACAGRPRRGHCQAGCYQRRTRRLRSCAAAWLLSLVGSAAEDTVPPRFVPGNLFGIRHFLEIGFAVGGRIRAARAVAAAAAILLRRCKLTDGRPWAWGRADDLPIPPVTHHVRLQLHVVLQRTLGLDAESLQDGVIGVHRFLRADFVVSDPAQEADKGQLILRVVDLAAE